MALSKMILSMTRRCAWARSIDARNLPLQIMFILDTDHISILDRSTPESPLARRLALVPADQLAVTIVSFEEQMRGWTAYLSKLRSFDGQPSAYIKLNRLLDFFCDVEVLPFDESALQHLQRLWLTRTRVGTMDLKIASIALAHDATELTRNSKDFGKVPGLRIEDWSI